VRVAARPRLRHDDLRRRTDRLEPGLVREVERAMELCEHVAGELHDAVETHVDPGVADDLATEDELRLSCDESAAADAVAADIHQRAAVELRPEPDVLAVREREAEPRVQRAKLADSTREDELVQGVGLQVVAIHERLHEDAVVLLGDVECALDVLRVTRHGLLAEDVLVRLERADRPFDMHRVRQPDVDRVDVTVPEQLLVASVRAVDVVLLRVCERAHDVAARDRNGPDGPGLARTGVGRLVDPRGREEAEPKQRRYRPAAAWRRRNTVSSVTADNRMTAVVMYFVESL